MSSIPWPFPRSRIAPSLTAAASRWVGQWAKKRQGTDPHITTLRPGRVYILPTGVGLVFAMMTFAMLALAVAGLTDASERLESPKPQVHLPNMDLAVLKIDDTEQGPQSVHMYDVTEVLESIRQLQPGTDAERTLLTSCQSTASSGVMRIDNDRLIAEATAARHQALKRMLDAWRVGGPRQILVELRVIQADLKLASSIDWVVDRIREIDHRGQPVIVARATDKQLRHFIQRVQADGDNNILLAPKVTLFNGQSATIADLSRRPFVTAVEPQEDGSLQPVIELFEDGFKIMLHPVTTGDGTVNLTFDLRSSNTHEVAMANLPFRHPQAPHPLVTIQVPTVSTTSVHSTVRLSALETLLIAAPRVFDETSHELSTMALFYAITPRLLDDTEMRSEATALPSASD